VTDQKSIDNRLPKTYLQMVIGANINATCIYILADPYYEEMGNIILQLTPLFDYNYKYRLIERF